MFAAVFGRKDIDSLSTDNEGDGNILNKEILSRIGVAEEDLAVESLRTLRILGMAAANADGERERLICKGMVSMDTELHIRHGSSLRLRNLKWLVTEQRVFDPFMGLPVLEALGFNNPDLILATADQFGWSIVTYRIIGSFKESGNGGMSRVMEGVFHAEGGEDVEKDQDNTGEWCDIGEETDQEWEMALTETMDEAEKTWMYPNGKEILETLIIQHLNIVRVKYYGGLPARVPTLQLHIKEGVQTVWAKPCR